MGEKRPYKARNPGGGRKKRKPEYDAGKKLKEQLDAAVVLYNSEMSLQAIADALSLNPIKARKLLITAGVYGSDTAKLVRQTFNTFRETQDYSTAVTSTMVALQLPYWSCLMTVRVSVPSLLLAASASRLPVPPSAPLGASVSGSA